MDDRRGNPSDPAEEAERVRKAYENLDNWGKRHGGFSGGVSMQIGSGRKYEVPIGDREIAQKVVSRPLPPQEEIKPLPTVNHQIECGPLVEPTVIQAQNVNRGWLSRLLDRFRGDDV